VKILYQRKNKKILGQTLIKYNLFNYLFEGCQKMPRPPKVDTVQFRRKLDNPKRQILLSAGQGNISKGFENLLELYQYLHGIGYRADSPLESIGLVTMESAVKETAPIEMNH
jgi:hypothetical protein